MYENIVNETEIESKLKWAKNHLNAPCISVAESRKYKIHIEVLTQLLSENWNEDKIKRELETNENLFSYKHLPFWDREYIYKNKVDLLKWILREDKKND